MLRVVKILHRFVIVYVHVQQLIHSPVQWPESSFLQCSAQSANSKIGHGPVSEFQEGASPFGTPGLLSGKRVYFSREMADEFRLGASHLGNGLSSMDVRVSPKSHSRIHTWTSSNKPLYTLALRKHRALCLLRVCQV